MLILKAGRSALFTSKFLFRVSSHIDRLIDWLLFSPSQIILCLEEKETYSLWVYIFNFNEISSLFIHLYASSNISAFYFLLTSTLKIIFAQNIHTIKKVVGDRSCGWPVGSLPIATTPTCRGGASPFPRLLYFTLDTYLTILSVKYQVPF